MGQAVREDRRVRPRHVRVVGIPLGALPGRERGGEGTGEPAVHLVPAVEGVDHRGPDAVRLGDAVRGAGVVGPLRPAPARERDPAIGVEFLELGPDRGLPGHLLPDVPDPQLDQLGLHDTGVRGLVDAAVLEMGLDADRLDQRVRHPGQRAGAGWGTGRGHGDRHRSRYRQRHPRTGDDAIGAGRGARGIEPGPADRPAGLRPGDAGAHHVALRVPGNRGELLGLARDQGHRIRGDRDAGEEIRRGRRRGDRGRWAGRDHDLGRVLPPSRASRGDDVGGAGIAGKDVADAVLGEHHQDPGRVPDGPGHPTRAADDVGVLVVAGGGEQPLVPVAERVEVGPDLQRVHPGGPAGEGDIGVGKGGPAGHQEDHADQDSEPLHPTP
jgi:hypothetical protein